MTAARDAEIAAVKAGLLALFAPTPVPVPVFRVRVTAVCRCGCLQMQRFFVDAAGRAHEMGVPRHHLPFVVPWGCA